jgi:hypothetical protein
VAINSLIVRNQVMATLLACMQSIQFIPICGRLCGKSIDRNLNMFIGKSFVAHVSEDFINFTNAATEIKLNYSRIGPSSRHHYN